MKKGTIDDRHDGLQKTKTFKPLTLLSQVVSSHLINLGSLNYFPSTRDQYDLRHK